jgi:hypothetical protein
MAAASSFTFEDELESLLNSHKINEVVYKDLPRLIRRLNYTVPPRLDGGDVGDLLGSLSLTHADLRKSELNENMEYVEVAVWEHIGDSPLYASRWGKKKAVKECVGYIKVAVPSPAKVVVSLYSRNSEKMFVALASALFHVRDSSRFFYGRFHPSLSGENEGRVAVDEDDGVVIGFSFSKRSQAFAFEELVIDHTGQKIAVDEENPKYLLGGIAALDMSESSESDSWQPNDNDLCYPLPKGQPMRLSLPLNPFSQSSLRCCPIVGLWVLVHQREGVAFL